MAAGYVVGDLALLKQKYPNLSNIELREELHKNAIYHSPTEDSLFTILSRPNLKKDRKIQRLYILDMTNM